MQTMTPLARYGPTDHLYLIGFRAQVSQVQVRYHNIILAQVSSLVLSPSEVKEGQLLHAGITAGSKRSRIVVEQPGCAMVSSDVRLCGLLLCWVWDNSSAVHTAERHSGVAACCSAAGAIRTLWPR